MRLKTFAIFSLLLFSLGAYVWKKFQIGVLTMSLTLV